MIYNFQGLELIDVQLLGAGLRKLPYENVAILIAKLQQQVDAQEKAAKASEEADKAVARAADGVLADAKAKQGEGGRPSRKPRTKGHAAKAGG